MNVAENSSILSTLSNDNLLMLTFLFRIAGLPISKYDSWYWKCYNHLILIFLYLVLIGYVISSLYRGTNDDYVSTVIITLIGTNGCFSYLTITYSVYFNGHNILDILKSMSTSEYNILSRVHDLRHISEMNSMLLRSYCWKWLFIAFFIAVASFSLFYLAYGSHADTHFLDLGNNEALRVTNIAYIYINVGWVLPFVLVRVGSHFLERRILRFIEYLESPKDLLHQPYSTDSQTTISQIILSIANFLHSSEPPEPEIPRDLTDLNISITQVLSWYDDIYALNQTLSNAFSPIIFQAIVLLFPIVVFILQGFLTQPMTAESASSRLFWLIANCFILFVMTGSAARLDALNIRIETAFASMPSTLMFASPTSVCQYRLALSKIRAIPLGINFFGLKKRISYQAMWTISSLVVSIFFFMLGYSI